jgi:UPF0755 protein
MKRHHHTASVLVWFFLFVVIGAAVGLGLLAFAVKTPYKGHASDSVLVTIPPRSSTLAILSALEAGGVIRDRRIGLVVLKVFHRGRTLKAGEYRFTGPRSAEQVILQIAAGDVVTYRVTVPEGFSAEESFVLFASQGFGSLAEYRRLFGRPRDFEGVPVDAPTLEGFLFPETYTVTRSMAAREIVSAMTRTFARRLPKGYEESAAKRNLTLIQAVTLASLVEKETALAEERPLVAAVYLNRLKRGMLLQADPTTIYALKRLGTWRGMLARSELLADEAYNTYVKAGLPPGPICSPGLASLRAAVAPAKVDYLYFVASGAGDASHSFSADYEGQQKNVVLYHERRKAAAEGP